MRSDCPRFSCSPCSALPLCLARSRSTTSNGINDLGGSDPSCAADFCADGDSKRDTGSCDFAAMGYTDCDATCMQDGLNDDLSCAAGNESCTQDASDDPRCTTAALKQAIESVGISGVVAAYCNARFLVIVSSGDPGFTTTLDIVSQPPGGTDADGSDCVTRTWQTKFLKHKFPLTGGDYPYTLLDTSDRSNNNNVESFPDGPGDCAKCYLYTEDRGAFGLPSGDAVGVTTTGARLKEVGWVLNRTVSASGSTSGCV